MAKDGILNHKKTLRLARHIGAEPGVVVGILETLWQWARADDNSCDGAISVLDFEDAMASGGWQKIIHLVSKLASVGDLLEAMQHPDWQWLEKLPNGGFFIHDWHLHTQDSIHLKLARAGRLFANGAMPNMKRLSEQERSKLEGQYAAQGHFGEGLGSSVRTACARHAHSVSTESALPSPTPIPTPKPQPNTPSREQEVIAARVCALEQVDVIDLVIVPTAPSEPVPKGGYHFAHPTIIQEFQQEIWAIWKDLYPQDQRAGREEYAKARGEADMRTILDGIQRYRAFILAGGDGGRPKKLKNWLSAKGWEEEWTPPPRSNGPKQESITETIDRLRNAT